MQTNSSHSQLILLEANFKINLNLASFPYSGWQISLWLFSLKEKKKEPWRQLLVTNRITSPCYSPKSLVVPKTLEKKPGHICHSAPCQETILVPPVWSDFTPHSFFVRVSFFDFVSNYSATRKSRWVEKTYPCIIVRISSLAWERLPQVFPTWLRCSPPQRSKGGYENRN